MTKRGTRHLCGEKEVQLTKDHIQPQCGFNEKHRKHVRLHSRLQESMRQRSAPYGKVWREHYYEIQPDKPIAGGIYRNTQCAECNGLLGECYDQHLGLFCRDAVANMKLGQIVVVRRAYPQTIRYPLPILKRILAMFFSINGSKFIEVHPELSLFIRQPDNPNLPERYRVFVGYNANDFVSHIPFQFRTALGSNKMRAYSQIAHPPFVYLLGLDSPCPDNRLVELTAFKQYGFREEANIKRDFRLLPTNNCFAGDFRNFGKAIPDDEAVFTGGTEPSFFRLTDYVV